MPSILETILGFFRAEKTVYSHRNRTIEMIAREKGIDINSIEDETRVILETEGSVEATIRLRKRFNVPLVTAWIFVERLEKEKLDSGTDQG